MTPVDYVKRAHDIVCGMPTPAAIQSVADLLRLNDVLRESNAGKDAVIARLSRVEPTPVVIGPWGRA